MHTLTWREESARTLVRSVILELAPDASRGTAVGAHLINDLDYHSLALLEVAFLLEDEFDLPPIDEEDAEWIRTTEDVEDYVVGQLRARGSLAEETP